MKTDGIQINQLDLVTAIVKHLDKQHKGLTLVQRQFNVIISAADMIVESFKTAERKA